MQSALYDAAILAATRRRDAPHPLNNADARFAEA